MSETAEITGFQLELPYELGRYRLDAEVGRGGMGIVYHAEDTMLERDVAVKVLLPQLAADGQFVERFKREAQMAARLEHPNIVTVHDVGSQDHLVYFVMRLIVGKPLDKLIEEGIPWGRAENVAVQVAEAMAYAHAAGVIHRDIKPENVIVSREGIVTITDFGLARPDQKAGGPTQAGVVLGTPGYMAPEQALGKHVDHRADMYAFGVLLYELITGDLPFDGETAFSIINQHISQPPPKVTDLKPNTPRWLSDLVGKLLEKEPDSRPASMGEVAETLKNQQGSDIETTDDAKQVEARPGAPADTSGQGIVAQVRGGQINLTDAMSKYPKVAQTLQEVFRKEVTVISLDLAGSTALKQTSGGTIAIGPVFSAYRELVDTQLKEHKCEEAVWAGDGTVALFKLPSDGVAAAQGIVRGLTDINEKFPLTPDLGVRVGIHTGSILRDPNLTLGQVTSTVLDITGHIQKDAKVGLVELSQATLDKLPSNDGYLRIRNARDADIAIFAWHPEGPDKVPQSWIQRMRYGRGDEDKPDEKAPKAAAAKRTTGGGSAAKRTSGGSTAKPAKPSEKKLRCPYCEGDVTILDQKCPHCDRLNRHYDESVATKGKKVRTTMTSRGPSSSAIRERTTMVEQRDAARERARAAATAPTAPGASRKQPEQVSPEALTEFFLGIALGALIWVGAGWALKTYLQGLWWTQRGTVYVTNPVTLFGTAIVTAMIGLGARSTQPALGAGVLFGLPVGGFLLWYLGWWVM